MADDQPLSDLVDDPQVLLDLLHLVLLLEEVHVLCSASESGILAFLATWRGASGAKLVAVLSFLTLLAPELLALLGERVAHAASVLRRLHELEV